jgi:hypothetical protein
MACCSISASVEEDGKGEKDWGKVKAHRHHDVCPEESSEERSSSRFVSAQPLPARRRFLQQPVAVFVLLLV